MLMLVLSDKILKFFRQREAELKKRFQPYGDAAQALVVAQDELDLWRRIIGHAASEHCDCLQME
jgi:hypothetical protein